MNKQLNTKIAACIATVALLLSPICVKGQCQQNVEEPSKAFTKNYMVEAHLESRYNTTCNFTSAMRNHLQLPGAYRTRIPAGFISRLISSNLVLSFKLSKTILLKISYL